MLLLVSKGSATTLVNETGHSLSDKKEWGTCRRKQKIEYRKASAGFGADDIFHIHRMLSSPLLTSYLHQIHSVSNPLNLRYPPLTEVKGVHNPVTIPQLGFKKLRRPPDKHAHEQIWDDDCVKNNSNPLSRQCIGENDWEKGSSDGFHGSACEHLDCLVLYGFVKNRTMLSWNRF